MKQKREKYPVVLRFEGLFPHQLRGYESHRLRKGGDLGHIDISKSKLNRRLLGDEDWADKALDEIDRMRQDNFLAELDALKARNRKKDIDRRMAEGPRDPWRPGRHGPMRELILTANSEFFDSDINAFLGDENERVKIFQSLALDWLTNTFGDDVIHARADLDEKAYHIHAVIMPRTVVSMTRKDKQSGEVQVIATRSALQPSIYEEIKDYEVAQDRVGIHFAAMGLCRGEKRKAAAKAAYAKGEMPPPKRFHTKPWQWRRKEDARIRRDAADIAAVKAENEAVSDVVDAVSDGSVNLDAVSSAELDALEKGDPVTPLASLAHKIAGHPKRAVAILRKMTGAWKLMRKRAREIAEKETTDRFSEALRLLRQSTDILSKHGRSGAEVPSPEEDLHETIKRLTGEVARLKVQTSRSGKPNRMHREE